jgi:23S rRNA (cytosine1962-C5)-methyltransferase
MPALYVKPGREKSILHHHPWIYSGSVAHIEGALQPGETVAVRTLSGDFLAWGAYSPQSQIRVRIWSWDPAERIGADFLRARLMAALELRRTLIPAGLSSALRLVHAESDGLPGLIVDRYNEVLVMQCLSTGPELWRETLADLLLDVTGATAIYERSDVDVRQLEGLPERSGLLRGALPAERLKIIENGHPFWVDLAHGHKTGFYLDQRDNRARVEALSRDRDVLNCFAYTGGFAVYALAGGARSVLSIDSSAEALAIGQANIALNGFPASEASWLEGDVFHELRRLRDQGSSFDLVVLDPPKFAPTAAQAEKAARGYKDINLLAFKLLRPGGLLVTFSCSGGISPDLFQKIVAGAALDAGVNGRVVGRLNQAPDHPMALNYPEGYYLKGLIIQV